MNMQLNFYRYEYMQATRKRIYLPLLLLCLLSSCYKEINLDEFRTPPKIVINCTVTADSLLTADITRTWFYADGQPYVKLPAAKVDLYVNGAYTEQMEWKRFDTGILDWQQHPIYDTTFVARIVPRVGDRLRLVVSADGYETAESEAVVPAPVSIEKVTYTNIRKYEDKNSIIYEADGNWHYGESYDISYEVTFTDDGHATNYYALAISHDYEPGVRYKSTTLKSLDPVLLENSAILDNAIGFDGTDSGSFLFTDRQINGKSYTLKFKETIANSPDGDQVSIVLFNLTEDYYNYLLSAQRYTGSTLDGALGNLGFGEPLRVYSNVTGGVGILGACTLNNQSVTLHYKE